jgi:NitT/TauT family transport system permease protein
MRVLTRLSPIVFFFGILLLWEALVDSLNIPSYILPEPLSVLQMMGQESRNLIKESWFTLGETLLGFSLASVCAFLMAVAFVQWRLLERGLFPLAIALKTTPIVAFAPMLVCWFGSGILSKVAAAGLICFFPVLINSVTGFRSPTDDEVLLFKSLNATRIDMFLKLRLPAALPDLFAALKISTSLAVVGAIVGEFVGSEHGLGLIIIRSSYHFETAKMFAATFAAALMGYSLFLLVEAIERKCVFWRRIQR